MQKVSINNQAVEQALATLELEIKSLSELSKKYKQNSKFLESAINIIVNTVNSDGNIILTGMGKSGHIAQKISATFASTGTPSFYLHPAEALHGDLGRISRKDTVLALSYSGKSSEIVALLPSIKRYAHKLIVISGDENSPLAKAADVFLTGAVEKEACPHNLAPTCSTTVQLAIGDALAIGVLVAQGFSAEDFYKFHPGGALGKKLTTVREVMRFDKQLPIISDNATIAQAVSEITRGGLGMTAIVNKHQKLIGLFTDGDLRRLIQKYTNTLPIKALNLNQNITEVMIRNPQCIGINSLAAEALAILDKRRINQLLVLDGDNLVGALNMHDLLQNNIL